MSICYFPVLLFVKNKYCLCRHNVIELNCAVAILFLAGLVGTAFEAVDFLYNYAHGKCRAESSRDFFQLTTCLLLLKMFR